MKKLKAMKVVSKWSDSGFDEAQKKTRAADRTRTHTVYGYRNSVSRTVPSR